MDRITLNTVVVDTISAIYNSEIVAQQHAKGKLRQDDWADYGVDVSNFIMELKKLGFIIVIVIGHEARGKSYGIKQLPPKSYLWFNSDNKLPTFKYKDAETKTEFTKWYGDISKPGPLMRVMTKETPMTFTTILNQLKALKNGVTGRNMTVSLSEHPVVFLIGHIQTEKGADGESYSKLKLPGKLASKYQIEGLADIMAIAETFVENGKPVRKFRIQTFGYDNARSPEGMFEDENGEALIYMPNDYNMIVEAISAHYDLPTSPQQDAQQAEQISTTTKPQTKPQPSK